VVNLELPWPDYLQHRSDLELMYRAEVVDQSEVKPGVLNKTAAVEDYLEA
jgi:hypothetical protein